jgi:DNA-binding NtrC family response regulator
MIKVLFVDDDENLLASLRRQVRRMRPEWDVQTAVSGAEALTFEDKMAFDVVVTDMSMPGMSGIQLVHALNQRSTGPDCIMLTGTADLETAAEIINTTRVSRFFTKPCPIERLVTGIEDAAQIRNEGVPVGSSDVNAGVKLHQLAGAKMHQRGSREGPRSGAFS